MELYLGYINLLIKHDIIMLVSGEITVLYYINIAFIKKIS